MANHRTPRQLTLRLRLLACCLLLCAMALAQTSADSSNADRGASKPRAARSSRKIVVACDWDFAPYEFINIVDHERRPDGYNVKLIDAILTQLGYPHVFIMKSRRQCLETFENGTADLIVDFRSRYADAPGYYRTISSICYYQLVAAHRSDTPAPASVEEMTERPGELVINNGNDSIAHVMLGIDRSTNILQYTAREALTGIENGTFRYFAWGEEPLKWKLKEYNLAGITLTPLNLKASEVYIVGHDRGLIDEIDAQLARMQQSGFQEKLRREWFQTGEEKPTSRHTLAIILLATSVGLLLLAAAYTMARSRVKRALRRNKDMEAMMHQALSMGNYNVIVNNLQTGKVTNQHGNSLPKEGITAAQMMERIHPDDRAAMENRKNNKEAHSGKPRPFRMRWNQGTPEEPQYISTMGYSYPEFDHRGRPTDIVIISQDITEDERRKEEQHNLANRYHKMFESSLVAMSFYSKEGHLIDMNEQMRQLCAFTPEQEQFFRKVPFFEIGTLKGIFPPGQQDSLHICQHMLYPEVGLDKYVELRIRATNDDDGQLLYYIITARDITAERAMYRELRRQEQAIEKAAATTRQYENELHTLLENCNMFVWHADMGKRIITFSRSLGKEEFSESFDDYINSMKVSDREKAIQAIRDISSVSQGFNVVHLFNHTPVTDEPAWFAISGMSLKDSHGRVTKLFGIVRNVTTLMEAQERLKEETARAENSAILKATFLANMTHEIRTPLNAIVGFADLLPMIEKQEERQEFIRIISNNCDMLTRLINDIFEASSIDVKPLEIVARPVDFAQEFAVVAQSLSSRVEEPTVQYITDIPVRSLRTRIDMGRMQQVITNFVTNAVKYTHEGHIKIGFRYERGGIYMYCEDTGAGIPKEKQTKVFDRFVKLNDFVQGTGLGLSICKSIAERAGGEIGVESEGEGHGSTFWIWVPCPKL